MHNRSDLRSGWVAVIIIVITGVLLCNVLPRNYASNADEGTYFRQGSALVQYGMADGYARIVDDYIHTPLQQIFPNPLRVGTIAVTALALHVHGEYKALSYVSILAFMALLAGVWWFVSHFWDRSLALATLLLMAVSPLGLAMARRALMDSLGTATAAASLFAFLYLLERRGRWQLSAFVACTTAALLVKETSVLLLPFYGLVMLWMWWQNKLPRPFWHMAVALCIPPLLTISAWLAAYGLHATLVVVRIVPTVASTPTPYTINYGGGPWFTYLIDFMALSPWLFLLAIAGMGSMALKGMDRWTGVMLVLVVWLLLIYAPLTKNVRYVQLLDLPIRFFAAGMLLSLIRRWWPQPSGRSDGAVSTWAHWRKPACWLPVALFALLAVRDVATFRHDFIVGGIYDPVTWNLLRVEGMMPRKP